MQQKPELQGGFFNWDPPKNHKYWKKLKYPNWDPPKNHKYGKKLKYPNWDPPKISKCGKKNRTKRIMFVFRVQQTAMVCEHTMEQQSFLVQSMPSGVNTKHSLLKLVCRFVTHGISFQSL